MPIFLRFGNTIGRRDLINLDINEDELVMMAENKKLSIFSIIKDKKRREKHYAGGSVR